MRSVPDLNSEIDVYALNSLTVVTGCDYNKTKLPWCRICSASATGLAPLTRHGYNLQGPVTYYH